MFSTQKGSDKRKNIRKEKRTKRVKVWVNTTDFPSLEFSKLCLTVETYITTLSDKDKEKNL